MRLGSLLLPVSGLTLLAVLLVGALLGFVLNRAALLRRDRRRLLPRLAAQNLALLCLMQIPLQPTLLVEPEPVEAVLVTPGATPADVSSAAARLRPGAPVFRLGPEMPDTGTLRRRHPEVRRLEVAGPGLREPDWAELGAARIGFEPPPAAAGIVRVFWSRDLVLGEELLVQGSLAGVQAPGRLVLRDPGGEITSTAVEPGARVPFELRAVPREAGRWRYRLELQDREQRPVFGEMLDVAVTGPRRLRVLWLEGAPRFEGKFFKSWLAGKGGAVALRSAVSRGRWRTEFLNLPKLDLGVLDAAVLERFDLVVADGAVLMGLGQAEREQLRGAVVARGLGVLVLADDALLRPVAEPSAELGFFLGFGLAPMGDLEERTVKPAWAGAEAPAVSAIPVDPVEIRPDRGLEPLVVDAQGHILAAVRRQGLGAVGLSLIRSSHRWALEGQGALHAAYWSFLCSELAAPGPGRWALPSDGPALAGEPLRVELDAAEAEPSGWVEAEAGPREPLALRQDPREPGHWTGTYWPREPGWHRLGGGGAGETWFYAQPATAWASWQQARKVEATRRHAALGVVEPKSGRERQREPISPLLFYLLFLGAMAYLWTEEKR